MKLLAPRLPLAMSLALAACGTPPSPPPSGAPATTTVGPSASTLASVAPRASAARRASAPPTTAPTRSIAADPPPLALEQVADGFAAPIGITPMADGALLVNERVGRVQLVDPSTGERSLFLDITDRVLSGGEQGLLGLALDPAWPDVLRAVVHYTGADGGTVIATFEVTEVPQPVRLDAGTERVILREAQPFSNHNGGQLAFGPDGYLYLGLGDGGSGGDPFGNGQNPASRLGKILRIDVTDSRGEAPDYDIPGDNPFADGEGGAPEVFLLGLRNPWRFSFDRETGLLWIADVGQNAYEEITRVDPAADVGANLGWNVMEGSHCFSDAGCDTAAFTGPITEYDHDAGCSITGGHVYRGDAIAGLTGWYVFGDYCSGTIFGIPSDVADLTAPRVLLQSGMALSAFGEGADGELYVADLEGGTISRMVAGG